MWLDVCKAESKGVQRYARTCFLSFNSTTTNTWATCFARDRNVTSLPTTLFPAGCVTHSTTHDLFLRTGASQLRKKICVYLQSYKMRPWSQCNTDLYRNTHTQLHTFIVSSAYFGLQQQMALRARDESSGWEARGRARFSSNRHFHKDAPCVSLPNTHLSRVSNP